MVNEKIAIIIIGIANIIIILIIIVPQPIIYFAFIILDEILSILQSHLFFYDHWSLTTRFDLFIFYPKSSPGW